MTKEATKEEPKRVVPKELTDTIENAPDANVTGIILDAEHSWYPFVLVICGTILMLSTIPLVMFAIIQRSIFLASLALVSLLVGLLMRRKGKLN